MRRVELPEGAVVIYPHQVVTNLFGYLNDGSTRKTMSEYGAIGQSGWPVEDVEMALDELRPGWKEGQK